MWEEKENGSDNALCHSYYTSQLLRPRRTLEVTGIICLSKNARPVPQPVCSCVILDFFRRYLSAVDIVSLCLWRSKLYGYIKCTHCRGNTMRETSWKQASWVSEIMQMSCPDSWKPDKLSNIQYCTVNTFTKTKTTGIKGINREITDLLVSSLCV